MPSERPDPVNAAFFRVLRARVHGGPEPEAAGADLLILENRRPRAMSSASWPAALGMSITIGIVDVLFVQADAVRKGRCLDPNWREDLYRLKLIPI
jgi:hypothetical protein